MVDQRQSAGLWQWLLLFGAIAAVVAYPVLLPGNSSFLVAETGESPSDAEDVELDESLELIGVLASAPLLPSSVYREAVTEKSVEPWLILASDHFKRGPPTC